jgi:hypothetical protein
MCIWRPPVDAWALAAVVLVPIAGARAKEKILYTFTGNNDGSEPLSGAVIRDTPSLGASQLEHCPGTIDPRKGCRF